MSDEPKTEGKPEVKRPPTAEEMRKARIEEIIRHIKEAPAGQVSTTFSRQEMETIILPALEGHVA